MANQSGDKLRSGTVGNVATVKCAKRIDPTELSCRGEVETIMILITQLLYNST